MPIEKTWRGVVCFSVAPNFVFPKQSQILPDTWLNHA